MTIEESGMWKSTTTKKQQLNVCFFLVNLVKSSYFILFTTQCCRKVNLEYEDGNINDESGDDDSANEEDDDDASDK